MKYKTTYWALLFWSVAAFSNLTHDFPLKIYVKFISKLLINLYKQQQQHSSSSSSTIIHCLAFLGQNILKCKNLCLAGLASIFCQFLMEDLLYNDSFYEPFLKACSQHTFLWPEGNTQDQHGMPNVCLTPTLPSVFSNTIAVSCWNYRNQKMYC